MSPTDLVSHASMTTRMSCAARRWVVAACMAATGCGWQSGERGSRPSEPGRTIQPRAGTIVIEGCVPDAGQTDSLRTARSLGVATDVVLVCAEAGDDGNVHLLRGTLPETFAAQVSLLHAAGYRVMLGLTYAGGPGATADPAGASKLLADPKWRGRVTQELSVIEVDGYELAFPQLVNGSRGDVLSFAKTLSAKARPARTVGIFTPPSISEPSDLPGGDAYDLPALRPYSDRFRLMTLDFSCCGAGPGPTIDPLWAASAVRAATGKVPEGMVDVSVPLYGVHFWELHEQYVSHAEAASLAVHHDATIQRTDLLVPHFTFSQSGSIHEVWFDDQVSILSHLASWKPVVVPAPVGVVYYGIGGEDGGLWPAIAEARP
ncbi:MAG: hypothetical protein HY898_16550 [Deltaproteobacteria bacterium]|nr:hypothetical protein [Deltaproteobacteria bacterium]